MAEILPRHYIFGILLGFTLVVVAGLSLISIMANADDSVLRNDERLSSFNQSFNKLEDIQQEIDDLNRSITSDQGDPGAWGFLNAIIGVSWNSMQLTGDSFNFGYTVLNNLSNELFRVPAWIPALIVSAILAMFVFTLISNAFQKDN